MATVPFNTNSGLSSSLFPRDLPTWLAERELLLEVYAVVGRTDWVAGPAFIAGMPAAVLRTLAVYSYATGLLASRDIECGIPGDATLRYICAGHSPTWQVIRQFRRAQIAGIRQSLEALLGSLFYRHGGGTHCYAFSSMGRLAGVPDPSLARWEAEFRMQLVLRADTADMDH